jgi:hypothetical protein
MKYLNLLLVLVLFMACDKTITEPIEVIGPGPLSYYNATVICEILGFYYGKEVRIKIITVLASKYISPQPGTHLNVRILPGYYYVRGQVDTLQLENINEMWNVRYN